MALRMPERTIINKQAELLYNRGVAAARGGQKALAEKLLRQAVKLNPQHEYAWLWLSGVLEHPEDSAFCLRAVLGINPENERAQRGLALLEQQLSQQPAPARSHARPIPTPETTDSWWSTWRAAQTTWLWTVRALLLIPIILIGSTLAFRTVLTTLPLPTFTSYRELVPTAVPTRITITPTPSAQPVPTATSHAVLVQYFRSVNQERDILRLATEGYRATTDGSRTTVERATATKQLRDQVQQSYTVINTLWVPPEIADTHALYLAGLTMERDALDQLLDFYRNYDRVAANRAALQLQEARTQIATATASWDTFAQERKIVAAPAGGQ